MDTTKIMKTIAAYAPMALLCMAAMTFIGTAAFQYDFYLEAFEKRLLGWAWVAAAFVAITHQLIRFALLISSARNFYSGQRVNGALGMMASLGVMWYDLKLAAWMEEAWASPVIYSTMLFLVIMGFILEIRLILSAEDKSKSHPADDDDDEF